MVSCSLTLSYGFVTFTREEDAMKVYSMVRSL